MYVLAIDVWLYSGIVYVTLRCNKNIEGTASPVLDPLGEAKFKCMSCSYGIMRLWKL